MQELNYSINLNSLETDVLEHPGASIPLQGVITSQPYRELNLLHSMSEHTLGMFLYL